MFLQSFKWLYHIFSARTSTDKLSSQVSHKILCFTILNDPHQLLTYHPFTQQIFVESLLCGRHSSKEWVCNNEKNRTKKYPCIHVPYIQVSSPYLLATSIISRSFMLPHVLCSRFSNYSVGSANMSSPTPDYHPLRTQQCHSRLHSWYLAHSLGTK